jgi:hypothetical protein
MTTTEIEILPLEKVIENKLIQNNVTEQVLAALKDKYGNLKLKALDDKESYLELKAAAKDCMKVRTLTTKLCKEGREDALKVQKLWIAKEKEILKVVDEVESPLDAEIAKFDAEVERKANEEKQRQEEAYINRQATLTKMGAIYTGGNFVLGEASFEANLVKESSDDVWEEAVVPKFREEYEKIEAVRIAEEQKVAAEKAEFEQKQQELARQQEEFRQQQAEMQRKQAEAAAEEQARIALQENARIAAEQKVIKEMLSKLQGWAYNGFTVSNNGNIFGSKEEFLALSDEEFDALVSENNAFLQKKEQEAEEKRLADIEAAKQLAIKQEQERQSEANRIAEEKRLADEAKKAEELAKAGDKAQWEHFIAQVEKLVVPSVKSGQYRKIANTAKQKLEEILAL